MNVVRRTH